MRITVRDQSLARDFFFSLIVVFLGAAATYVGLLRHRPETAGWLALGALVVGLFALVLPKSQPILQIDETGVFDRRLGVGKISWADVEAVQIEGGYGNRFLCLQVREPERYVRRLSGGARAKAYRSHDLGFKKFGIDLRDVNINLLDLKRHIESRITG
jgi:hypothetical protein